MTKVGLTSASLMLICFTSTPAKALTESEANQAVERHLEEGSRYRNESPNGDENLSFTPGSPLIDSEVLRGKMHSRTAIIDASGIDSESALSERIETLIDERELTDTGGRIVRSPVEMDERKWQSASLSNVFWSSPIWPMYRGHTSQRYAVKGPRTADSFKTAWDYVRRPGYTFFDISRRGSSAAKDNLSPAEKYDLLLQSPSAAPEGVFSKSEWARGERVQDREGDVAKWYGYCHGWAAASIIVPRPLKVFSLRRADRAGSINFYPSDVKGLAVALWANKLPRTRFIGKRCYVNDPPTDENGRIVDDRCRDVNSGTFHMALVNQLANAKRTFLMDATYDQEVWNQPIVSYSFRYFNPQTGPSTQGYAESVIPIESFTNDKYRAYRTPNTRKVVGVVAEVIYGSGSVPLKTPTDGPRYDRTKKATYVYDLELDQNDQIVGGEWYQTRHPDFLWSLYRDKQAVSDFENIATGDWDHNGSLPSTWVQAAVRAGAKSQPLAKILERLIQLARMP